MFAEITFELFYSIVSENTEIEFVEKTEHCFKTYFVIKSVRLLRVENFVSGVNQYFVQVINS